MILNFINYIITPLRHKVFKLVLKMMRGDYVVNNKPKYLVLLIAKFGSVDAQYELALLFRYKNKQIFEHYAYAAYEQGHIAANFELAKYFRLLGSGGRRLSEEVFINYIDLAYEHFEVAAEAEMVEAQELLADMHRIGEGSGVPDWDIGIMKQHHVVL